MSTLRSRSILRIVAAATGTVFLAAHAAAVDPAFDSLRPLGGPTAGSPSDAMRSFQRDIENAPPLTERFGLPRVSGPIPPILLPARQRPVFDTPDNAWPPPVNRARRPAGRDG